MKRKNDNRMVVLFLGFLMLIAHGAAGEKTKKRDTGFFCTPVVFEFRQNDVHYSFTARIGTGQMKSHENWIFTPLFLLVDGQDSVRMSLPSVSVDGDLYAKLQQREELLSSPDSHTYDADLYFPAIKDTVYTIPYQGSLSLEDGKKIRQIITSVTINSCCNSKALPEQTACFSYINADLNEPFLPRTLKGDGITSENLKIRKVEGHAFIHFDMNKSDILLDKSDNRKQIEQMTAAFRKILTDPYARFDSAYIKGQSSPEGPFEWNNKLALKRSESAFQYLMKELNQLNIPYQKSQFHIFSLPEAWDELCDKIETSDLDADEKKIVLKIIRNTPIKAEREYLLRQRRNTFRYICEQILGNIRRVDYAFYLTFKDLTLEEQISLLHTRPDIYSPSDFLAVANYMTDKDRKIETLRIAKQYYPENPDILATLLDACLSGQRMEEAGQLIGETTNIQMKMRNPKFLRNMGVYYLQNKQSAKLLEQLNSLRFNEEELSDDVRKELRYQSGLLALQAKEYPEAAELLAGFGDMNSVLALLGMKQYAEAWRYAKSYPCREAREFYVQAIAAAYSGEREFAGKALEKAVQLDSSLYDKIAREYAFKEMDGFLPTSMSN